MVRDVTSNFPFFEQTRINRFEHARNDLQLDLRFVVYFCSLKLRIPVSNWKFWFQGNPTKLMRYMKMKAKGYSAIDLETEKFILENLITRRNLLEERKPK
jgi:hypothetical protein